MNPVSHDVAAGLLTDEADDVFAALADRTRRRILVRLVQQPDDAGAVARELGVSRQAVAKHLGQLVDAELVIVRTEQRRRVHSVDPARIREVSDLLGAVSRGWDDRLSQVRKLAEAKARDQG